MSLQYKGQDVVQAGNSADRAYATASLVSSSLVFTTIGNTTSSIDLSNLSGSFTGSFTGTSSFALTSSYSTTLGASLANNSSGQLTLRNSNNSTISTISRLTASLALTASFTTGSIFDNTNPVLSGSYALTSSYSLSSSYAISSSYALTASFASTASYVTNLNQTVTLGNITSTPSSEATLNVYPPIVPGNGEGGQILLAASGGLYTSASMLDTYQNYFRILRGTNTGGSNAQLVALDLQTGNFTVAGAVSQNAWTAGQIIRDIILSNTEVTISTTTVATSTSDTDFLTYNYTPISSNSYLVIHYHLASYDFSGGTGNDSYFSRIKVDGSEITYSAQSTVNGNRSGVLFPLTGRYTNSSTAAKSIVVACRRNSADDSITIVNTATSMWLRITEIAR